ncbi:MAG: OmpH family outer membrane protein [Bacteroidales bacterium]|nr:OmpH family outer membrane protein [Bacteroidales bacterium]
MRRLIFTAAFFIASMIAVAQPGSQKIACVDTDYVLLNIPEYGDAQEELNVLSEKYLLEINNLKKKFDKLQKDFDAQSVLMTDDQKKKKEAELDAKEAEIKSLQMKYFGPDGELATKRSELIQPIQEKIYNAITNIALVKNYAFVLDKASGTTILYFNDKNDISDDVLDEIGSVMQTVRREDRKKASATSSKGTSSPKTSTSSSSHSSPSPSPSPSSGAGAGKAVKGKK